MELVLSLGAALGIGGGAAPGGSSLLLSIAQGTLTAFSAASSIGAGLAARSDARVEELGIAAQASRDKIAADDEAVRINRAMAQTVGDQAAAFAAAGIALGSGTPTQARQEARRQANEDFAMNRSNRNANAAAWAQRGYAARRRGENAFAAGVTGAIGDVAGFAVDTLNRGGPTAKQAGRASRRGDPWAGLRG